LLTLPKRGRTQQFAPAAARLLSMLHRKKENREQALADAITRSNSRLTIPIHINSARRSTAGLAISPKPRRTRRRRST
jgi:hypothetical protein